jgi:hypothetical protein
MIIDNKKVFIYWKKGFNAYSNANKDHLLEDGRLIGSSLSGVNKMLSKSGEQKSYMKEVLGISASSPDWDTRLANYWNSLSVEIPIGGKELEIGFIYDVTDSEKADGIKRFNESNKDISFKSDEDIRTYFNNKHSAIVEEFNSNITKSNKMIDERAKAEYVNTIFKIKYEKIESVEGEKYKYATPISISDYVLYRYCLVYSHVANEIVLVDKSKHIRFYLHSEEDIKKARDSRRKLEKERMEAFLEVVKNPDKLRNVMYVLRKGDIVDSTDDSDMDIELNKYSIDHTAKFIATVKMANLDTVALIEEYVSKGLLKRLEGTEIIVDYADPSKVIGNELAEAIVYFNKKENEKSVLEYKSRLKGLPKKVN